MNKSKQINLLMTRSKPQDVNTLKLIIDSAALAQQFFTHIHIKPSLLPQYQNKAAHLVR